MLDYASLEQLILLLVKQPYYSSDSSILTLILHSKLGTVLSETISSEIVQLRLTSIRYEVFRSVS